MQAGDKINFFRRVPLWVQIVMAFASFAIAQCVAECVAVWATTGHASAFFASGVRVAKWKPDIVLSNGQFVALPVDLLVLLPLWVGIGFGSIAVLARVTRRFGIVLVCALCGIAANAAVFAIFPHSHNFGWSPQLVCHNHLRQIGLAFKFYADDHNDALPPDFPALVRTVDITTDLFICRASNDDRSRQPGMTPEQVAATVVEGTSTCSYFYARHLGMEYSQLTARHILVYEKSSNHSGGMNILFGDGRVEWVPKGQFEQIVAEVGAGQNPPPSVK